MRIYQSTLLNQPVYKGNKQLSRIKTIGIDYDTGKITQLFFNGKACSPADVINWKRIELKSDAEINTNPIVKGLLKKQKVYTRGGRYLGRISDFQIDTDQLRLSQVVVKTKFTLPQLFRRHYRLISAEQIYKIDSKEVVIFEDSEAVIKKTAQPLGATLS